MNYVGDNCRLSATLVPNVPEFIEISSGNKNYKLPEIYSDIKDKLIPHGQELDEKWVEILSLLSLCQKHNIYPFLGLEFNNSFRQFNIGKIKELVPIYDPCSKSKYDLVYKFIAQPFQLSRQKRWYSISFVDFMGENVEGAKKAIKEFTEKDYKLNFLHTVLNPRTRTADHYHDYEEHNLSLYLTKGKITTYDNIPDDFKMPTTKAELETFFKH